MGLRAGWPRWPCPPELLKLLVQPLALAPAPKCRGEGDGCYGRVNARGSLQALCGIDTHRALLSQPCFQGNKSPSFLPRAQNSFFSSPPRLPPPALGPTDWEQLGRMGVSSWCRDGKGEQSLGCPLCCHPLASPQGERGPWGGRWRWEEGSGGSSHALGPCCSILSLGQGRTKPGLFLQPRGAGCVGRRAEGGREGAGGTITLHRDTGPTAGRAPRAGLGSGTVRHKAEPWRGVKGTSPQRTRVGGPHQQQPQPPERAGAGKWGER